VKKATLAVVVVCLVASAGYAAPITGTYEGPEVLEGRWSESFNGGGPSELTNEIAAGSWDGATLGTQWEFSGAVLTGDTLLTPPPTGIGLEIVQWQSDYDGGTLILQEDAATWGVGDGPYTVELTSVTQSTILTLFNGIELTAIGAVSMTGTFPDYPGYEMTYLAATASIVGQGLAGDLPAGYPALTAPAGQWGSANIVKVQIIPEPTTMALLGLAGALAMIRRRRMA